jgi:hypothetical protein
LTVSQSVSTLELYSVNIIIYTCAICRLCTQITVISFLAFTIHYYMQYTIFHIWLYTALYHHLSLKTKHEGPTNSIMVCSRMYHCQTPKGDNTQTITSQTTFFYKQYIFYPQICTCTYANWFQQTTYFWSKLKETNSENV